MKPLIIPGIAHTRPFSLPPLLAVYSGRLRSTFSVSVFFVLLACKSFLGCMEMLHLLVLNTVIKMLSHTCHNKKLLFGALFIADSQLYCKQATVTTICTLAYSSV